MKYRTRMQNSGFATTAARRARTRLFGGAGLALLAFATVFAVPALIGRVEAGELKRDDYILGPQDKVRLRVFEWHSARDEVFEWRALNAEYSVGPSGTISLPLIGEVAAADKTTSDLAVAVGQALKAKIGLVELPNISVEVVQFRPFYIIGDVDKPGEYAYRPDLTVLQAVTLAGGKARERTAARFERDFVTAQGDLTLLESDYTAALIHKARLEAELNKRDDIDAPAELQSRARGSSLTKALMYHEILLFNSRKASFATDMRSLQQLKAMSDKEAQSVSKEIEMQDRQIALLNQELGAVSALREKGLTSEPRKLALERTVAQLQADRYRLDTNLARARQDSLKAEMAIQDLPNKRMNEITADLRETQVRLDQILHRVDTTNGLLAEAQSHLPDTAGPIATASEEEQIRPYVIVRMTSGHPDEMVATETTLVKPGDTIKVLFKSDSPARVETIKRVPPPEPGPNVRPVFERSSLLKKTAFTIPAAGAQNGDSPAPAVQHGLLSKLPSWIAESRRRLSASTAGGRTAKRSDLRAKASHPRRRNVARLRRQSIRQASYKSRSHCGGCRASLYFANAAGLRL